MCTVNTFFRSKLKLTGILAINALVGVSLTVLPARPAADDNPMLFVSERRDVHLRSTHVHENFFKVSQDDKSTFGFHAKTGDRLFNEADFYARIDEGRKRAPSAPIVVFVHGCCVSFGEQLYQGFQLKKAIDAAVSESSLTADGKDEHKGDGQPVTIAYDWAAPFSYATSLVNAGGAQSRFDTFMRRLANRYGAENIVIVAHSLGTVLTQNYIERLEDKKLKPYAAIIFSRADLDRQSFADCLPDLKEHSARLLVLSSDNDPNIYFSSLLRKLGVDFFQAVVLPAQVTRPLIKKIGSTEKSDEVTSEQSTGSQNKTPVAGDEAPSVSEEQRHKGLTRRLGQVKVAREFGTSVEVYDMSSFRIGHGIPYEFIGDLLFNNGRHYQLKKDADSVVIVRRARP